MRLIAVLLSVVAAVPAVQSARALQATPTRSVEGVWTFSTLTPLERSEEFAGRALISDTEAATWARQTIERNDRDRRDGGAGVDVARAVNDFWFERGANLSARDGGRMTSLIIDPPDGRLPPLTAAARSRLEAENAENRAHPADGPENRSLQERCLSFNAGPPMLPGPYNNIVQIFEMPGYVVIENEMIHDARVIPLDGRPRPPARMQRWQGESRARWQGDTLVIDTTHFTDANTVRGGDARLHLVERLTRLDADTLHYAFTVDDPTAFARSWTALLPMTRTTDALYEYACHEGNHALEDILRGARYQERQR